MKKSFDRSTLWSSVLCLLPIAFSLFFYDRLPDQIPTHWGLDFTPNGYSSKATAVFLLPLAMLATNLLLHFLLNNDPKRANAAKILSGVGKWAMPVISILLQTMVLASVFLGSASVRLFLPIFLGLMFVIIGNYLPKCRQNYTVGYKIPWTLHSETNWNKTHKLAGYLWVVGGLLMMVLGLWLPWVMLPVLLVITVIPVIYSIYLYRTEDRH